MELFQNCLLDLEVLQFKIVCDIHLCVTVYHSVYLFTYMFQTIMRNYRVKTLVILCFAWKMLQMYQTIKHWDGSICINLCCWFSVLWMMVFIQALTRRSTVSSAASRQQHSLKQCFVTLVIKVLKSVFGQVRYWAYFSG